MVPKTYHFRLGDHSTINDCSVSHYKDNPPPTPPLTNDEEKSIGLQSQLKLTNKKQKT